MIPIIKGDILESNKDIIIQQVNCQGVMGKGLALQILNKYPEVKEEYVKYVSEHLKTNHRVMLLGKVNYVQTHDGIIVANIFGQDDYRKSYHDDGVVYTSESTLLVGICTVIKYANEHNLSVAIPVNIGCGLAGGDWNSVYSKIEKVVELTNVDVTLYEKVN